VTLAAVYPSYSHCVPSSTPLHNHYKYIEVEACHVTGLLMMDSNTSANNNTLTIIHTYTMMYISFHCISDTNKIKLEMCPMDAPIYNSFVFMCQKFVQL
jgi:hypothetical protein